MHNYGQLNFKMITYEGHTYGIPIMEDGAKWEDVAPPAEAGWWYIAVLPDGQIISAEPNPMHSMVVGKDIPVNIWRIEHPGPVEAIRSNNWDGENVVPRILEQE